MEDCPAVFTAEPASFCDNILATRAAAAVVPQVIFPVGETEIFRTLSKGVRQAEASVVS